MPEVGPLWRPGDLGATRQGHGLDGRRMPGHQQVGRGPLSSAPKRGERWNGRRERRLLVVRNVVVHVIRR
jgi:hypothetical protein